MKFLFGSTSGEFEECEIEVKTIEELMEILDQSGSDEIIIGREKGVDTPFIEIYDSYRE